MPWKPVAFLSVKNVSNTSYDRSISMLSSGMHADSQRWFSSLEDPLSFSQWCDNYPTAGQKQVLTLSRLNCLKLEKELYSRSFWTWVAPGIAGRLFLPMKDTLPARRVVSWPPSFTTQVVIIQEACRRSKFVLVSRKLCMIKKQGFRH